MGILNVTPDSFSDGGRYHRPADAVVRGREMVAEGADVIDVGGESTRPGADPVPEAEELLRVLPVVEALAAEVRVSIDTTKPAVAAAAIALGATLVNDVSAMLWPVAAEHAVGWVAMHRRGTPATMQRDPSYDDVVAEVTELLLERSAAAAAAGVEEIWLDPGIGFGKTTEHNLQLLAGLSDLVEAASREGSRVMVGTSRKRFLGVCGAVEGEPLALDERFEGSLATAVWAMQRGAQMVRVHDVAATVEGAVLVGPGAP